MQKNEVVIINQSTVDTIGGGYMQIGKLRWFYPDTSYIYGGFKRKAREYKKKIKPTKNFKQEIKEESQKFVEKNIKFVISELTEFEIKSRLMAEEGLNFQQANQVYHNRINECPIYVELQKLKEVSLNSARLNEALQWKLELADFLHILIATKLSLFAITKDERDFGRWKRAYPQVMSPADFQKYVTEKT